MLCSLVLWHIIKAQFGMKPGVVMFFQTLLKEG